MKTRVSRNPQLVRQRILDAATAEFVAHGFESASTNRITVRFQGSKSTLFRYFPRKEDLLIAVVRRIAGDWERVVQWQTIDSQEPREWLEAFATRTLAWVLDDGPVFLGRLAVTEGRKIPALDKEFEKVASKPLISVLAAKLKAWTDAGLLACDDPRFHAERFLDLTVAGVVSRRLYGHPGLAGARLRRHVKGSVGVFLNGTRISTG